MLYQSLQCRPQLDIDFQSLDALCLLRDRCCGCAGT